MKKHIIFYILLIILICSCNDEFLERYPLSEIAPENFFTSANELELYSNGFYQFVPSAEKIYGYDGSNLTTVDDIVTVYLDDRLRGTRVVPTTGGDWDWKQLRSINILLENLYKCKDEVARKKYKAVCTFFRAWFYFDKVQKFGEVPWYSNSITSIDEVNLLKARNPRTIVMDSVLADINFAITNLGSATSIDKVTKWTALALKSRICLFEGTFRKYHSEFSLPDANRFLDECISASEELINSGSYSIYKTTPQESYLKLFASMSAISTEIILARKYSSDLQVFHNVNYFLLTPSFGRPGLEKKLVNSYLMADGSRFTDIPGYATLEYSEEVLNRDPRLAQTIRCPGYTRIGETIKRVPDFSGTATGYQIVKYLTSSGYDSYFKSCNDIPVFRYAEVLLNYAEAKAERENIDQTAIDKSIKLLRDRVGMPNLNLASANLNPDPYLAQLYKNVTGVNMGIILEVRRERTIELVMEGLRWWDLMRWKEGHLIADQFKGMYFPGVGSYDFDKDGVTDVVIYSGTKPTNLGPQYLKLGSEILLENGTYGNIVLNPSVAKTFNESKDYLYPIPINERLLNPKLTQNPGWVDGL